MPRKIKNLLLIFMSLVFYSWGEGKYVLVMISSILVNHLIGMAISRYKKSPFLIFGIGYNLAQLIAFKYLNFFQAETGLTFWENIHLPIGVSFFTFQSISFIIDVHRNPLEHKLSLINTATYISLFPQLIAGPIVRYNSIAKQLHYRKETLLQAYYGASRFIVGLAKKVLIANQLGYIADEIFKMPSDELGPLTAFIGVLCYTFQIFFDFSGYSDMAIGLGRIFGFKFPENFNFPYNAKSIREFWRKWHMTLSSWFRDYLYIPLGGNKKGKFRTLINLMIVFILCGFWHGPNWTFLIWGMWHGLFLGLERMLPKRKIPILNSLYVMFVVIVGWVFFKSPDYTYAFNYLGSLFSFSTNELDTATAAYYLNTEIIIVLIAAFFLSFFKVKQLIGIQKRPLFQGATIMILLILSVMYVSGDTYNPFIYFQF